MSEKIGVPFADVERIRLLQIDAGPRCCEEPTLPRRVGPVYEPVTEEPAQWGDDFDVLGHKSICGELGLFCEMIRAEVLERSGVSLHQLLSASRFRQIVDARRAIAIRLKREAKLTLKEICPLIGLRNHTSVIYLLSGGRK